MSAFGGLYVTREGKQAQSKMAEGKMLKFVKVGIGDGEVSGDLEKVTELGNEIEQIEISNIKPKEDGSVIFSFNFSNTASLGDGFYWRELGLYVEEPDTKEEVLYAYGNAGQDAEYIPPYDSNDIVSKKIDLVLIFENTDNIVVQLDDSAIFMTENEVEQKISEIVFKQYLINIEETIAKNTDYQLPVTYIVGNNSLRIFIAGVRLIKDENYIEVGQAGEQSNIIQFLDWDVSDGYSMLIEIKGESVKIYSEEEAIEAVEEVWIQQYGNLKGVYVQVNGYDVNKNYVVAVINSSTTLVLQYYIVNRLTLEISERG